MSQIYIAVRYVSSLQNIVRTEKTFEQFEKELRSESGAGVALADAYLTRDFVGPTGQMMTAPSRLDDGAIVRAGGTITFKTKDLVDLYEVSNSSPIIPVIAKLDAGILAKNSSIIAPDSKNKLSIVK